MEPQAPINDAQLHRVIQYCRSRRHPVRDETTILTSFYAGLRGKEIASLIVGNVFDEGGNVLEQFILTAEQSKGGHFSANTICQLFLDIYKAVGLKDASSHLGRRTYITCLANKGVGVRLLAELAGHSHISTTQRYIDVNAEQLSEVVELLSL